MPSISVISFSPYERYHLLLCELDDTMFIVDCGWPINSNNETLQPDENGKTRTEASNKFDPRDVLSTINWARVDFILISNYEQMTLLPYITEYTEFSGPVYATEPAKAYGRCLLEAGLVFASRSSIDLVENGNQYDNSLAAEPQASTSRNSLLWQSQFDERRVCSQTALYSQQDIIATMEKVTDVRHNEIVNPVPFVQACTRSSGYCIGGANWTVEYKGHRTAFVSTSSFAACLHPQEWDGRVLSDAQVIVFCDASDPSSSEHGGDVGDSNIPQNIQVSQRINQLCSTAMATLKQRGRVLLVGEPYGVTLDVLQLVAESIISHNLPMPQFIIVSPVGERTLQYGNIMGEWLCESKQALLYLPEYPFADKDLRQKGHLHFARSLSDLATMKIPQGTWFVIVSPQDVSAVDHFIRQWKQDATRSSNADIATSSGAARYSVLMHGDEVAWAQSLVRHISVGSELTYVPVSCRLTFRNIEQSLLSATSAQQVLVPSHIYARLSQVGTADGSAIRSGGGGFEFKLFEYSYLQATTVDLDTDRHLPLSIQKEMTNQMKLSGKQHAVVSGTLSLSAGKIRFGYADTEKDNEKASLDDKPKIVPEVGTKSAEVAGATLLTAGERGSGPSKQSLAWWTPERLASELNEIGVNATAVSGMPNGAVRIVMPSGSATIRMDGGWLVDCTSTNTQWTVIDSLRQVLKLA